MSRRRLLETGLTKTLGFYREERRIAAGAEEWTVIGDWQRKGLVRLRWAESSEFCFVILTDEGKARAQR